MSKKIQAIVLLSAGLDSSVNLYEAVLEHKHVKALTFNYGQKAFAKEQEKSAKMCRQLGVPHQVIDLRWLAEFSGSSLTTTDGKIPSAQDINIDSLESSLQTAKSVWVPNRNGAFLNIAAVAAEGLNATWVIPGFNLEEAETFPDNSEAFIAATNNCFRFSTQNAVQVKSYTIHWNKTQIVKRAIALDMDFGDLWPCYHSHQTWCGDCESCLRFKRALSANGLDFYRIQEKSGL